MVTAVRKIHFCAGHRVMNHESKCATLHGHNYNMYIHARAPQLDSLGRVIDFGVLNEIAGNWIDTYWDHTTILDQNDKAMIECLKDAPKRKPLFLLPENPTAENLAEYFLKIVCPDIFKNTGVEIYKVVLWETENCFVEVSL